MATENAAAFRTELVGGDLTTLSDGGTIRCRRAQGATTVLELRRIAEASPSVESALAWQVARPLYYVGGKSGI
jgi:hypothetical protein